MSKDETLKLIERLVNEADLCRNEGANDIAALLDEAAKALTAPVQDEFDIRGMLASKLTCWNRLRETEESELVALVASLSQPAPVQEPVAWLHRMDNTEGIKANGKGIVSITQKRKHPFGKPGVDFSKSYPVTSTPLYATPPAAQRQWVGLREKEILKLAYPIRWQEVDDFEADKAVNFAQAIEAKLKEKNNG
jgi:hypothetical protein